jgi:hypothetical protein
MDKGNRIVMFFELVTGNESDQDEVADDRQAVGNKGCPKSNYTK